MALAFFGGKYDIGSMRTYVYVDGFNLYYRGVKDTAYKWLNLKVMCQHLLDRIHDIQAIKYFTAPVSGKIDVDQPIRQQTYLRALLKYIPEISIYEGIFLSHTVKAPLAKSIKKLKPTRKLKFVEILKTEEKGSDVNLAVHALNDSWLDNYDCAVIISNDSDLAEALRLIREQHNRTIGILYPWRCHPSKELTQYANFVKRIRRGVLARSQLPDPIPGTSIHKPKSW